MKEALLLLTLQKSQRDHKGIWWTIICHRWDSLDEIDKFLETDEFQKPNQETENMNKHFIYTHK